MIRHGPSLREHNNYIRYIDRTGCGRVYPLSVAEAFQQGDIVADGNSVLFWHYCGFAFVYGEHDEEFLNKIYEKFICGNDISPRRFILFISDEKTRRFFSKKENAVLERRYFFEYRRDTATDDRILPASLRLCEISGDLFDKINGNVTPRFLWSDLSDFLKKGAGYCITDGETAAAWAFTAAVSSEEIDIGIETRAEYRHSGFGAIVAEKMIQYCLSRHKRPVWACHSDNIASQKLAEKTGFVKTAECFTVKRRSSDLQ